MNITFWLGLGVMFCSLPFQSFALNPALPPSGNFDLNHWKLQLPIDSQGTNIGNAAEISTPLLLSGFTNAYFYTGTDGAMTFWAPDNGATTSGSIHPRSELRELINTNDSSVNWVLYGTHTLNAQCKVLRAPADTGEVCIGQIHETGGANIPMVFIAYQKGKIHADIWFNGENNSSSVTYQYGTSGIGSNITYQISVVNGLVSVAINGITNTVNVYQSDPNWATNLIYFKAGDYNQTTNQCNCATDGAIVAFYSLARYHAPSITAQPTNVAALAGTDVSFSLNALGNGNITYQWWLNSTNLLNGATNSTLGITNVSGANVGSYSVVVNDNLGSITSSVATLTGYFPPVITSQPTNQTLPGGNNATFTVNANGTSPLSFRWWFNSNSIAGATNNSLVITNSQPVNAGSYYAVITNAYGSVTSSVVTLSLNNYSTTTNVFLDAFWADARRTNTSLPLDSAWYANAASSLNAVSNALIGLPDPASTLTWWTYFTSNSGTQLHLGVGDSLRATLKFTASGVINNTSRGLRIGIYNSSGGTRSVSDGSNPNGTNITGYMLNLNFSPAFNSSSAGNLQFLERTNLPSSNLIGTVADYNLLGGGGPTNGAAGFSNGIPCTMVLTLKRNAGTLDLTATFTNTNNLNATYTCTDSNAFTSDFDTFVFRPALQSQSATNFTFTEFKVELVAGSNHPPVAAIHRFTTTQNKSIAIPVSTLLATDSDLDGDALSITSVDALSTNNGTASLAGGYLNYTPPFGYLGADSLGYALTDARGGSATGNIFMTVAPRPRIINPAVANQNLQFIFNGIVSNSYLIQATTNLANPIWITIATNNCDSNGVSTFMDLNYSNFPIRFYRVAVP